MMEVRTSFCDTTLPGGGERVSEMPGWLIPSSDDPQVVRDHQKGTVHGNLKPTDSLTSEFSKGESSKLWWYLTWHMTYGLTKSQVQHPWNPWGIGILLFLELSFYTLSWPADRGMHLWVIQNSPVSRACYTGSSLCSTNTFVLQGFEVCCLSHWPCPSYLATQRRDKKQRTGVNVWMVASRDGVSPFPFPVPGSI